MTARTSPSACSIRSGPIASCTSSGVCPPRMPTSPSTPRAISCSSVAGPDLALGRDDVDLDRHAGGLHLLGLLDGLLDPADQEERLLGQVVVLALAQRLERRDRLVDRHVLAREAGELLGHEERLRQEPLDLAGPRHDDLVLLGELVHAEDRDDVLQVLVPLQDLLHAPRASRSAPRRRSAGPGSARSSRAGRPPGRCRATRCRARARSSRRGGRTPRAARGRSGRRRARRSPAAT